VVHRIVETGEGREEEVKIYIMRQSGEAAIAIGFTGEGGGEGMINAGDEDG
jgi:hypothetical protein